MKSNLEMVIDNLIGGYLAMDNYELIEKWISVFGKGVDKKMIDDHVTSYCNHLWHLFTWGNVPCLSGEEARRAFDVLHYTEAIRFYGGQSNYVENISVVEKLSANEVDRDNHNDVYIVAKDFSWTYVRTHELDLGPYLCVNKTDK